MGPILDSPKENMVLTYSALRSLKDCPRRFKYRFLDQLVSLTDHAAPLRFGSIIHEALEIWLRNRKVSAALDHIQQAYATNTEPFQQRDIQVAMAMMVAYSDVYQEENFEVIDLEWEFEGPILNPQSGEAIDGYSIRGKVDGVVKSGEEIFILEHKTVSRLSGNYLENLWLDFQINLYCYYVSAVLGQLVNGVIYDILLKPLLRIKKRETEAEFFERLKVWFKEPGILHREVVSMSEDNYHRLSEDLHDSILYLDWCRSGDTWFRNTARCYDWNRPCPYLPLCRSNDSVLVRQNQYEIRPPHEELSSHTENEDVADRENESKAIT